MLDLNIYFRVLLIFMVMIYESKGVASCLQLDNFCHSFWVVKTYVNFNIIPVKRNIELSY